MDPVGPTTGELARVASVGSAGSDWEELVHQHNDRILEEFQDMQREEEEFRDRDEAAYRIGAASVARAEEILRKFPLVVEDRSVGVQVRHAFPGSKLAMRSLDSTGHELGSSVLITKLPGSSGAFLDGRCFAAMCKEVGLECDDETTSPCEMPQEQVALAKTMDDKYVQVSRRYGYLLHPDNHVECVDKASGVNWVSTDPGASGASVPLERSAMTVARLFDESGVWYYTNYFSGTEGAESSRAAAEGGFGSMRGPAAARPVAPASPGRGYQPAGSVADEEVHSGASNVSGGVVRRGRRKLNPTPSPSYAVAGVARNYNVASGVLFNNVQEVVLDAISPNYAQEILEEIFASWGLPFDNPTLMKYAEDLVFTFLIATTASDKADYNRSYDLPAVPGRPDIQADFKVLSDTVVIGHRLTRRQFARGLADRLRVFIRADENAVLQATIADRAGCQYQYGDLCFDGSTHCLGLTPSERAFVRTLEARNLFESDSILATGASDKLLTGFNQRQAPRLTAA